MTNRLEAAWVAPMSAPPLRDGAVVFDDTGILAVGPRDRLRQQHPDAQPIEFPSHILLPGLVNAHTHLELSDCLAGESPGGSFADWIISIRSRMKLEGRDPVDAITQAVGNGVRQCLRFGISAAGDISQQMHITRPALKNGPLRVVSYGEVLGLAKLRGRYEQLLPLALDASAASEFLTVGLSPHAPYTVDLDGYRQCLQLASERRLPLATHLSESPDEQPFLEDHAGAFRQLWERLALWAEPVNTYRGSPLAMAAAIGLLDHPTLLAHVNYCDDDELAALARSRASIVYCPRTHAYFGHRPHRWRQMLAAGINVAVGTDSCASAPDLNLVDELRLLHRNAPEVDALDLWKMATTRAARAIGQERTIGSLDPGKHADIVVFEADSEDPMGQILESDRLPHALFIAGRRIY